MPTFICKTLFSQCIEQKAGSADGQKACKNNINNLCGSLDPNKAEVGGDDSEETTTGTTATTAAPTSTNTRSSDNSEDVTTTNSDDFAAPTAGPKGIAAMAALGLVAALV